MDAEPTSDPFRPVDISPPRHSAVICLVIVIPHAVDFGYGNGTSPFVGKWHFETDR